MLKLAVILLCLAGVAFAQTVSAPSQILDQYRNQRTTWFTNVWPFANTLFGLLAIIEFAWSAAVMLLEKADMQSWTAALIRKIMWLGAFYALLIYGRWWIPAIVSSFEQIGQTASGTGPLAPSDVFVRGLNVAGALMDSASSSAFFTNTGVCLSLVFAAALTVLSFTAIIIQFVVAMVESYIVVAAGIIFVGFGGSRWTAPYVERYIGLGVAIGVKIYTPNYAPKGKTRAMTAEEVNLVVSAMAQRERVLLHMAIFAGFRPGEMLALQRRHVSEDATVVKVEQRVYRGDIDRPKTDPSRREVAIPPRTAELLREWLGAAVGPEPEAYLFASERGKPVWKDTLMYDYIRPKLRPLGLDWVDFQVMRSTHASIGHRLRLDPKVTADQRGHGVGVAIEEYTKTSVKDRAIAARKLEQEVLGKSKIVRMPRRKAS